MVDFEQIKFARTAWANIQLSKLCPNNDITKLQNIVDTKDFAEQMNAMFNIILILKEAFDRKEKYNHPEFEPYPLSREDLENMDETELEQLLNKAFETFGVDGAVSVETSAKKSKGKNAESPSN